MNQSHEQDMEIGYEETPPTPTYEGLEQRFKDEIMKLAGEQSDAVNAEFIRGQDICNYTLCLVTCRKSYVMSHHEHTACDLCRRTTGLSQRVRILEINTEYQEMLSALKAQQATRREEFLRKELQARLNQYHEDKRNQCPNTGVPDLRGYTGNLAAGEAIGRSHGASEHKHDGEQAPWLPSWRSEGSDARVILTAGEASGRLHGATEYNHDGGRMPPLPSWRSEETEARVASTAGETIGRFHGPTESKHDKERSPTLPSGRGELRVPLPPGRVYNNRAEYH
ncbi:hypothetical protein TanjilG_03879 [Lupinus angustifolius]|uniref:Uncharacterized protein n=1 Tax=Lupinus angustifolius TaxID=3871 RepID=A0A4P1R5J7_LUPAN|nr:hypothetical protein TanjilG_03879 [Lupinus angustifolius]